MFKKQKKLCVSLPKLLVLSFLTMLCIFHTYGVVSYAATGLIPDTIVPNSTMLHLRYSMDNYGLDFYYQKDSVFEIVGDITDKAVSAFLFTAAKILWFFSVTFSRFTSFLLGEAYNFDLISKTVDGLSGGLQKLFGVTNGGFLSKGFLPELLVLTLLFLGGYIVWTGLIKRAFTKAYSALFHYTVVFILSVTFVLNAGTFTNMVNEISNSISASILGVGMEFVTGSFSPEAGNLARSDDSVENMKEILFDVQIREPWLYLQFGSTDVNEIGESRVKAIESKAYKSDARKEAVVADVEDNGNTMLSQDGATERLAVVLLFLILNIVISLFVLYFAGLLLVAQVMLLVFVYILPLTFMIGLLPGRHVVAYKGIEQAFRYMVIKIGISFILMLTFSLSSMVYLVSEGYFLIFRMILQLACYIAVFKSLGKLTRMMGEKAIPDAARKQQAAKEWKRRHVDGALHSGMQKVGRLGAAVATGGGSERMGAGKAAEDAMEDQFHERNRKRSKKDRSRSDIYEENREDQRFTTERSGERKQKEMLPKDGTEKTKEASGKPKLQDTVKEDAKADTGQQKLEEEQLSSKRKTRKKEELYSLGVEESDAEQEETADRFKERPSFRRKKEWEEEPDKKKDGYEREEQKLDWQRMKKMERSIEREDGSLTQESEALESDSMSTPASGREAFEGAASFRGGDAS